MALLEAIPPEELNSLSPRKRKNVSRDARHAFHSKLEFNDHELVQSESEGTVLPSAHFGGHGAWWHSQDSQPQEGVAGLPRMGGGSCFRWEAGGQPAEGDPQTASLTWPREGLQPRLPPLSSHRAPRGRHKGAHTPTAAAAASIFPENPKRGQPGGPRTSGPWPAPKPQAPPRLRLRSGESRTAPSTVMPESALPNGFESKFRQNEDNRALKAGRGRGSGWEDGKK